MYNLKKDPLEENNLVKEKVLIWDEICVFVFPAKRITEEKCDVQAEGSVDGTVQDRDGPR